MENRILISIICFAWSFQLFAVDREVNLNQVPDESGMFKVEVIFQEGASSDRKRPGLTSTTFKGAFWGSIRFAEDEIHNHLDFFGGDTDLSIGRNQVRLAYTGHESDLIPKTKKLCHVLARASFAKKVVRKKTREIKKKMKMLEKQPLYKFDWATMRASFNDRNAEMPIFGHSRSLGKIKNHDLQKHMVYFNDRVKKQITYTGPSQKEGALKRIFIDECKWGKSSENIEKKPYQYQFSPDTSKVYYLRDNKFKRALIRFSFANEGHYKTGREVEDFFTKYLSEKAIASDVVGVRSFIDDVYSIDFEADIGNTIELINGLKAVADSDKLEGAAKNIDWNRFSIVLGAKSRIERSLKKQGVAFTILRLRR